MGLGCVTVGAYSVVPSALGTRGALVVWAPPGYIIEKSSWFTVLEGKDLTPERTKRALCTATVVLENSRASH